MISIKLYYTGGPKLGRTVPKTFLKRKKCREMQEKKQGKRPTICVVPYRDDPTIHLNHWDLIQSVKNGLKIHSYSSTIEFSMTSYSYS